MKDIKLDHKIEETIQEPTTPEGAHALPPVVQPIPLETIHKAPVLAKEFAIVQTPPVIISVAPVIKKTTEYVPQQQTKVPEIVPVVLQQQIIPATAPPLAVPENTTPEPEADFDNNTLKPAAQLPRTDWECEMCTLLNPLSSNICAVCATIRKVVPQPPQPEQKPIKLQRPSKCFPNAKTSSSKDQHYRQLVDLDNREIVRNAEPFECIVCLTECAPGDGVTLRECLHQFCRACLAHTVEFCEEAEVKCPYRDDQYACDIALQDREVKALVSVTVYEQHLAKSMTQAENKTKSFHCKTPDCRGWCIFEDNVNEFRCPVCRKINCLTCQAIHMGSNCKQYQERMKEHSDTDIEAKKTRKMLDEMVAKGEALKCPTCQVVLMKKWGCDWLRCSMCKTEICWVTRGPRWGPAGKGDISGGCLCGVNGVKCHPQCNYCH